MLDARYDHNQNTVTVHLAQFQRIHCILTMTGENLIEKPNKLNKKESSLIVTKSMEQIGAEKLTVSNQIK